MKSFVEIEKFLLPNRYKKYGRRVLVLGIPVVLSIFSLVVFQIDSRVFIEYWDEFGGYLLHIPLSLGLFWILFSHEKEEDEMYHLIRLKAMFHGIRFIFVAILMLPGFALVNNLITGDPVSMPNIGGNLAVVTLMLVYANGSYWYMKRKLHQDEE